MALRSLASATVSFGMVSIPVNLFSAAEPRSSVSFNMLHAKCKGRLKQQYICPADDDEVVPRNEMVKGYEFEKGRYVTFSDDEVKALQQEASKLIEITEFVPLSEVDPIYYSGGYYVGPDKGGDRAYQLLAEAMRQTSRCAIARWSARGKQYLVLLRPYAKGLVMQQLHYPDEIRSFDEVPIGDAEVKEGELQLAQQLIEQIATDRFEPKDYEDEVKKRLLEAIERKKEGEEISAAPETPPAKVIDLMEALKASLAEKSGKLPKADVDAARTPADSADEAPAKRVPRASAARTRKRA